MDHLTQIEAKIEAGFRLDENDALRLFESPDLMRIGSLADRVNRKKNHDRVYFNINRHINPTNICALSCKFCAFSRKPGEEGAYAYDIDEMVTKAREAISQGATELHMVGGLHPRWPFKRYLDMISTLHREFPQAHLKAFTAVELDWMARRERRTIAEILADLKSAGLGSLPGGGAEIFHPEIRDQICDTKVSAEQWLDTHRTAHKMGLRSNCTMLYGHIEKYEHRVDHMRRLRDLQDETSGFNVFIPLSFQPYQNDMGISRYTFGYDDLKTIAVARLFLDNFMHIKSYWVMMGQDIAQLGLSFGANDFDGTVTEEKISRMAGGRAGMAMSRSDLEHLILRTGRTPVERDTLYRPINLEASLKRAADLRASAGDVPCQPLPASRAKKLTLTPGKILHAAGITPAEWMDHIDKLTGHRTENLSNDLTADATQNQRHVETQTILLNLDDAGDHGWRWADVISGLQRLLEPARAAGQKALLTIKLAVELTVELTGMMGISDLAAAAGLTPQQAMAALAASGVRRLHQSTTDSLISSNPDCSANLRQLHRLAHDADIPTTGNVVLKSQLQAVHATEPAASRVDWAQFKESLQDVSSERRPLGMTSVMLSTVKARSGGSIVTAQEYLEAIHYLRSFGGPQLEILTPVMEEVPVLAPVMGLGSDGSQHPAQKIVPLLADFGADDLGVVDPERIRLPRIIEDIWSAGIQPEIPQIKDFKDSIEHLGGLDLRHKPGNRT